MLEEQGSFNLVQNMGHQGPVLRPRCIRPGRDEPKYYSILFYSCKDHYEAQTCCFTAVAGRKCAADELLEATDYRLFQKHLTTLKLRLLRKRVAFTSKNVEALGIMRILLCMEMYRTIILPVVLYGCETWSPTLREERRLRVFENMVLRRIFGPRRDEVTGGIEEIA